MCDIYICSFWWPWPWCMIVVGRQKCWIILTTKQTTKVATIVGLFFVVHDLDFANSYTAWPACFFVGKHCMAFGFYMNLAISDGQACPLRHRYFLEIWGRNPMFCVGIKHRGELGIFQKPCVQGNELGNQICLHFNCKNRVERKQNTSQETILGSIPSYIHSRSFFILTCAQLPCVKQKSPYIYIYKCYSHSGVSTLACTHRLRTLCKSLCVKLSSAWTIVINT